MNGKTIILDWITDDVEEGEDQDQNNPLSRVFNNLVSRGQPFDHLSVCIVEELPRAPDFPRLYRWLGVFVHSSGGRILFFPGYDVTQEKVCIYRASELLHDKRFHLDHISLEKNLQKWHITTRGSQEHIDGPRTKSLGQGRHYWFSLTAASLDVFRPIRKVTSVRAKVPESDLKRRIEVWGELSSKKSGIRILPDARVAGQAPNGMWHFEFIVGPRGFTDYEGVELRDSPFHVARLPRHFPKWSSQSSRLCLSVDGSLEVQIRATRLPTTLRVPISYGSF